MMLVTNSMRLSPSEEANSRSASHEIHHLFIQPKGSLPFSEGPEHRNVTFLI